MNMTDSIEIYVADTYGRGCPSNRAGTMIGVGFTAAEAIKACEPWANQAPWFRHRARKVLVVDGAPLSARDERAVAWLLDDEEGVDYFRPVAALRRLSLLRSRATT